MRPKGGGALSAAQVRAQAYAEERAGRIWQAIALLQESVERGPDDWTNVRILADLLTRTGQRKAANEHYRRLAQNCELDQLHAQAIAVWKRILANEPESASAHLKIGELYTLAGLRADARRHYGTALARFLAEGRAREVAQVQARLDQLATDAGPDGARPAPPPLSLEQAAGREEAPPVADAASVKESLQQARLFRRYGLHVQARARLDALLAQVPADLEGRRELAALLREAGSPEEAGEHERLLEALEKSAGATEPVTSPPQAAAAPAEKRGREADAKAPPPPAAEAAPVAAEGEDRADGGHQIGRDDYGTRYDLGIAYREMGLLDEAIAELQLAAADPSRLAECAGQLAECYVEQGKPERAVKWLEKGLAVPDLPDPRRLALQYHLATASESIGETARALELYAALQATDPGFRDVADRVRRLSGATGRAAPTPTGGAGPRPRER